MSASTINLWGIAYSLQVLTPPDTGGNQTLVTYTASAWAPEALRIRFDVRKEFYKNTWFAEIFIYNLNPSTEQNAIQVGSQVVLSAGFQAKNNFGIIFTGQVLQPTWERENGTDYKVGLRCVAGFNYSNQNLVATNMAKNATQVDAIRRMAAQARTPFQTDLIDFTAMDQRPSPRGQVLFGDVGSFMDEVAHSNDAQFWCAGDRPAYGKLTGTLENTAPDVTYAPPLPPGSNAQPKSNVTYSIMGTPRQTQDGVDFKVLLDSRVDFLRNRPMIVEIDQSQITQMPIEIGTLPAVPFEQSGRYYVAGLRHIGDSRGSDWFTEINGFTSQALQQFGATS